MLRLVVDTNVLVAALTNPGGSAARIVQAWRAGEVQMVGSSATLREADLVLSGRWLARVAGDEEVAKIRRDLAERVLHVKAADLPELNLSDDSDRRLAEAAVSGDVDYLVTADRELLALGRKGRTRIVKPSELAGLLSRSR
jgi:putative PIN family toxin of toxin-antitoxin system